MTDVRRRPYATRRTEGFRHPGRVIAGAFAGAIAVGAGILSLPWATNGRGSAPFMDALFTATSAVCVTGLATVDTGTFWSPFGQVVILLLIQLGGLGIMTFATLFAILLSRRLGLRARLIAQAETKALSAADVRRVIRNVVLFSLATEAVAAGVLTGRFLVAYDVPFGGAVYDGVFHAVSAFNNAGFSTNADNLMSYVTDPWVTWTIALAVIVGGLGFPVVFELARSWRRPRSWSVLTHVTVTVTVTLLVVGTVVMVAVEGSNPATLGRLDGGQRVLAGFFAAVMPRTAGFNSIDIAAVRPETLFATDVLMFIGGGSAGTAGGIKVTTFGLLAYVMRAEMRGQPDVEVGRRRVPSVNQRQALSVALMGIGIVTVGTFVLMALSEVRFEAALFEVVSAFATVGLTAGVTPGLPTAAQVLVVVLMYVGRIGPLTLASALAARERSRLHRLPEERMIVG